jgi:hypothetical protein
VIDEEPRTLEEIALWTAVDGLRIRYVEEGNRSGPDILLLGPAPRGLSAFDETWSHWSSAGRAVAVDLPGVALSEHRDDLDAPESMARYVARVFERLRLRHPHLVAPGTWCACALRLAGDSPGIVESLIVERDAPLLDTMPAVRCPLLVVPGSITRGPFSPSIAAWIAGEYRRVPPGTHPEPNRRRP